MPQTINTNISSLNSQRSLNLTQNSLATSLQRLSSGLRINSAMDDAAGLAVAMKMDSQIRGMNVALRNASDGISFSQVADTAQSVVSDQLQRMRELATQSLNGTLSTAEREKVNTEYSALQLEAARVQGAAMLNGQNVLSPVGANFSFQVGPNAGDSVTAQFSSVAVAGTDVLTTAAASIALASIDTWLGSIASNRASMGGLQSRLTFTMQYLQGAVENQTAAKSRIMDADFAAETANLSRSQILQQAGIAMVAQANQLPQQVMTLVR